MFGSPAGAKLQRWALSLRHEASPHGSSEMPHLHLPTDHTEEDLVLAANVAEVVGSADLYVAWSHGGGAGAVPEVYALMRDERTPKPLGRLRAGIAALLRAIFR